MLTAEQKKYLKLIKENPAQVGKWLGFNDLTALRNEWLKDILFSREDITIQAHRVSYKTTTLSLFFALHVVISPGEKVIYFRKTDANVAEITRQTANILRSACIQAIVQKI